MNSNKLLDYIDTLGEQLQSLRNYVLEYHISQKEEKTDKKEEKVISCTDCQSNKQ